MGGGGLEPLRLIQGEVIPWESSHLHPMNTNLKVTEVNSDTDKVHESLGITPERHKVLHDKLVEVMTDTNSVTDVLCRMSEFAETPNELAFMSFAAGHIIGKNSNPLAGILASMDQEQEG